MKPGIISVIVSLILSLILPSSYAQESSKAWTLRDCIDYALQNNIQVQKMEVGVKENEAGYVQSKAAQFPTLNAGIGEAYTYQKNTQGTGSGDNSSLSGSYSLRSEVTLYNGFRLKNTIAQQALNVQSASLGVDETKNNIELAVTEAYLQVLYARESVTNAQNTLTASEAQVNRSRTLYEAGYIAESNFAQVEAQYSNDSYSLVMAQNDLNQQMLSLKQLLELGINQDLNLYFPELKDEDVVRAIPDKQQVFNTAVSFMPEIQNSRLSMESASLGIEIAKAGFMPSLSLSASASAGTSSLGSNGFTTQLGDNFYQNTGVTLSIPIFNNKQAKTSLSKAKLNLQTAKLTYAETEKDLVSRIESAYLAAVSAQSRFLSASDQLQSTLKSYTLVEDQYNLGMKNTVDLLTEKTKYLSAQQEYLQAKYTAILNFKLLDFYQQKKIEL